MLTRPGRSAAYYMGMQKIRQLRELAIEELGPAFDLREFHDLVLKHGSMPMAVLEALVQDYIAEKRLQKGPQLILRAYPFCFIQVDQFLGHDF